MSIIISISITPQISFHIHLFFPETNFPEKREFLIAKIIERIFTRSSTCIFPDFYFLGVVPALQALDARLALRAGGGG